MTRSKFSSDSALVVTSIGAGAGRALPSGALDAKDAARGVMADDILDSFFSGPVCWSLADDLLVSIGSGLFRIEAVLSSVRESVGDPSKPLTCLDERVAD